MQYWEVQEEKTGLEEDRLNYSYDYLYDSMFYTVDVLLNCSVMLQEYGHNYNNYTYGGLL